LRVLSNKIDFAEQRCRTFLWLSGLLADADEHVLLRKKNSNDYRWLVGRVTGHSVEGGHSSPIAWPLRWQRAYSSQSQVVALNHVGCRPHLSPRVLPFASATKALVCYSFTDPKGWQAELA